MEGGKKGGGERQGGRPGEGEGEKLGGEDKNHQEGSRVESLRDIQPLDDTEARNIFLHSAFLNEF